MSTEHTEIFPVKFKFVTAICIHDCCKVTCLRIKIVANVVRNLSDHGKKVFNAMGAIIGNTGRATPGFQEANIGKLYDLAKE